MYHTKLKTSLKNAFGQAFQEELRGKEPDETIRICRNIVLTQKRLQEEERTGFFQYLSDIFRFDGIPILGLQAAALLLVCLNLSFIVKMPALMPVFTPLFALAILPVLFRGRQYDMTELEASTRASGAQIALAKLMLAGGANLVCLTLLLWLELSLNTSPVHTGQLILYAVVPYVVCMAVLLRGIRLRKYKNIQPFVLEIFAFCLGFGVMPKVLPKLYEASATGVWIIGFLTFGAFFLKELIYITNIRKRGKMYGIIA